MAKIEQVADRRRDFNDRRKSPRVRKQYIVVHRTRDMNVGDSSTIKDISRGGIHFNTTYILEKGVELILELRTPFSVGKVIQVNALVMESRKIPIPKLYAVRAKFINLSQESLEIIKLIEKADREKLY